MSGGPAWGQSARKGIVWSIGTVACARALTLLATLVLARVLVPEQFGVVAAILAFLAFFELGSDLGMKATVVYEQARDRIERLHTAFTINIAISVVLCGLGVLLAPLIAGFFGIADEADLFRLAMLSLLFTGLGNIHDALLMRDLDFRRRAVPELARGLVRAGVSVALALAGEGAASLVYGLLAGQAVWAATLWSLSDYRPRLRLDRSIVRSMGAYGSNAMMLDVIAVVATRADAVVIGRILGPPALGIYVIAQRFPEILISNVSWGFSRVAFPALSQVRADDRRGLAAATMTLFGYQVMISLPLATMLAILAVPATIVLFGPVWAEAGPVMAALAVVAAVGALGGPFGDALKSIGRQGTLIALCSVQIPLMIVAIVLLAPKGLIWVTWAIGAQSIVQVAAIALITTRTIGIRPREIARALRPALAGAIGVAVGAGAVRLLWPAPEIAPLVAGIVCGTAGALLALRLLAPGDFASLIALGREALARRSAGQVAPPPIPPAHLAPSRQGAGT